MSCLLCPPGIVTGNFLTFTFAQPWTGLCLRHSLESGKRIPSCRERLEPGPVDLLMDGWMGMTAPPDVPPRSSLWSRTYVIHDDILTGEDSKPVVSHLPSRLFFSDQPLVLGNMVLPTSSSFDETHRL